MIRCVFVVHTRLMIAHLLKTHWHATGDAFEGDLSPERFHPINFVLYISVPYTLMLCERKKMVIKNKIIIDIIFLHSHTKIAFFAGRTSGSVSWTHDPHISNPNVAYTTGAFQILLITLINAPTRFTGRCIQCSRSTVSVSHTVRVYLYYMRV